MKIIRPKFHFIGIQIKSLDIFKEFAYHLDYMEAIVGIHNCEIKLENIFVCPEIDWAELKNSTPMEKLLHKLIKRLN